jgi:hypothetical protein
MAPVRELLVASSLLLLCLPVSVLLTLFLLPLWSWLGARFAVPAVGPSGPAAWCFAVVYGLLAGPCLVLLLLRWRRARQ